MKRVHFLMAILLILIWSTFSVFVVPPIGAIPEGKTIIIFKPDRLIIKGSMDFIETLDHMQYSNLGKVTLIGRLGILYAVSKTNIVCRLPHSSILEWIGNGGSSNL